MLTGALEEQQLPESSDGLAQASPTPQAAVEAEGQLGHGRLVRDGAGGGGTLPPCVPPALRYRREKYEVGVPHEVGHVRDDVRGHGGA